MDTETTEKFEKFPSRDVILNLLSKLSKVQLMAYTAMLETVIATDDHLTEDEMKAIYEQNLANLVG